MKTLKKSILKSKTFWINILMAILTFIPSLVDLGFEIPAKYVGLTMLIVNIILRFITKTPIGFINEKEHDN